MKILYAVQATGNGHISRAKQLLPYLLKYGSVDCFVSGANYSLNPEFSVKYKSRGVSLFYAKCGKIDFMKSVYKNNIFTAIQDARRLPVEKYDVIINDFESITALACRLKNKQSVSIGHQASFMSEKTPRPQEKSRLGEMILSHYARCTHYIGLHFRRYDEFIFEPIIKEEIKRANPIDKGHITIYLPSYKIDCLKGSLLSIPELHFHFFTHETNTIYKEKNITFYPINNDYFSKSMIECHGLITGGGFETPSEALYLNKKLLSIPIQGQYEQLCNATALSMLGVPVITNFDYTKFDTYIRQWMSLKDKKIQILANNIPLMLESIFDNLNQKFEYSENFENTF
ncbi:MAG: hypothetical protein RLZZ546_382 [Bacteroidota bacterium]|jgi:uncharacterized protein (TIGR00661 family)